MEKFNTSFIVAAILACTGFLISACGKEDNTAIDSYTKPIPPEIVIPYGQYKSMSTQINGIDATKTLSAVLKIQLDSTVDAFKRPIEYQVIGSFKTVEITPFNFSKIDTLQNAIIQYSSGQLVGGEDYNSVIFLKIEYIEATGYDSEGRSYSYFRPTLVPKTEFLYAVNKDGSVTLSRFVNKIKQVYVVKK